LWSGRDKNQLMRCPTFQPKSYQTTSIANQLHSHPCHHHLICSDNDIQWVGVAHLADVSHAGSDLWSGRDKNQLMWFAQLFSHNPTRWHPYSQSIPFSSMPSSLAMFRQWYSMGWCCSSGRCESCWVRFVARTWQKSADVICPTFQPKSYKATSIEPINSILIHAIISW
jgi:hypothetical protein